MIPQNYTAGDLVLQLNSGNRCTFLQENVLSRDRSVLSFDQPLLDVLVERFGGIICFILLMTLNSSNSNCFSSALLDFEAAMTEQTNPDTSVGSTQNTHTDQMHVPTIAKRTLLLFTWIFMACSLFHGFASGRDATHRAFLLGTVNVRCLLALSEMYSPIHTISTT